MRQLEAHVAAALVAVAFPGAVEGGLIVVDGQGLVILPCSETREMEIDDAVAGFGLEQSVEVGDGLVDASVFGQGLGEFNLSGAVGLVGERRTEGVDGDLGVTFLERHFSAMAPALCEIHLVAFEGMEEQVGEYGYDDDDENEAYERYRILKYEASERSAFLYG